MKSTKKTALSNRVEQLRKEHHLSQTELGDMMLLTTKSIGLIESGNNSNLFNYIKLADIFKVSLDYIVGRADKRQIDQDGLDEVDLLILNTLKKMNKAEKEKCLKHIELEISLKSNSDK